MKSLSKLLITLLVIFACSLMLVISLFPTIASSDWGKDKLLLVANRQIPGSVSIEKLSINWFGPQELQGVTLKDPQGDTVLSFQAGVTQSSLFQLLWNKRPTDDLKLQNLNGILSTDSSGITNLQQALNKSCCLQKTAKSAQQTAIDFKNVNAALTFGNGSHQPLTLQAVGETAQGNLNGNFRIDVTLNGVDITRLVHFDEQSIENLQTDPNAELKINADVSNFPVALLDELIVLNNPKLGGLLSELLGQKIDLKLSQTATRKGINFDLKAQSPLLSAEINAIVGESITLAKPAKITLKTTPSLVDKILALAQVNMPWKLQNAATSELIIENLNLPVRVFEGKNINDIDLTQLAATAKLTTQQMSLRGKDKSTDIDIQQMQTTLQTDAGSNQATITLNGEARQNGQPFKINLSANVTKPKKWADFEEFKRQLTITGEVKGLPLASLDAQMGLNGALSQTLGQNAGLTFSVNMLQNKPLVTLSLKSDFITIPNLTFWLTDKVVLAKPSNINIQFSAPLIHQLLFAGSSDVPRLKEDAYAEVNIASLSMPLSNSGSKKGFLLDSISLEASVALSPLLIDQIPMFGDLALRNLNIQIDGRSLTKTKCTMAGNLSQINPQGLLSDLLGEHTEFSSQANVTLSPQGAPSIDSINLQVFCNQDQTLSNALLEKLDVQWVVDNATSGIKLNFMGTTRVGSQSKKGQILGTATLDNLQRDQRFDYKQATLHLDTKTIQLPSAFLGALTNQKNLTQILGDSIDANVTADIALASAQGTFDIDIKSEQLSGTANLKFDKGIALRNPNNPAIFYLNLTPQGYAALRSQINNTPEGFNLIEPAQVMVKVNSLKTPWTSSSEPLTFWKSGVELEVSIDKLVGFDKETQNKLALNSVRSRISSEDISNHTAFEVRSEGLTFNGALAALDIVGALEKGFNSDGSLNKHNLSLSLDATADNLPVSLICQIACLNPKMNQKLDAIIGNTLNAKVKAQLQQMNGPIYIELKGNNGHTIIDAQLTDGNMTFKNNFYAELNVTPQLGKHVLQDMIPFLSGIQGSDQPLKLAISKEGTFFPLRQLSLQNIVIGAATLELGKVRFSNDGQLAKVLSLLTTASANEIQVWFTPTYFEMANGVFNLERVDMLISDRYPIAAWGKVDTGNDNVNMVIALSGSAIRRAFNVPGIKQNYFLQLPLRGTMGNASIDKAKAVARLSALVAQSQGGPHGLVLGTVLDIATGGLSEESPPKPTTDPLPWNNLMDESSETESGNKEKKVENKIEKVIPIEEIGKGAGNLLKKIFK